jgi:hypothetical protein
MASLSKIRVGPPYLAEYEEKIVSRCGEIVLRHKISGPNPHSKVGLSGGHAQRFRDEPHAINVIPSLGAEVDC